jgi:hypothetical protein
VKGNIEEIRSQGKNGFLTQPFTGSMKQTESIDLGLTDFIIIYTPYGTYSEPTCRDFRFRFIPVEPDQSVRV